MGKVAISPAGLDYKGKLDGYKTTPRGHLRVIRGGKKDIAQTIDTKTLFSKEAITQTNQILDQQMKTLKKILQPLNHLGRTAFSHFMINAVFTMSYDRRRKETFELFQSAYSYFRLIYNKICHLTKAEKKDFLKYLEIYEQNSINDGWKLNNKYTKVKVRDSDTNEERTIESKKKKPIIISKEREISVVGEIDGTMIGNMKGIILGDVDGVVEIEEGDSVITTRISQKNAIIIGKLVGTLEGVLLGEAEGYVRGKIRGTIDTPKSTYSYGLKKMLEYLEQINPSKGWKDGDCYPFLDESTI